MTATAVSWNDVRGIHFSFGPNFTAGNRQGDLNAVFSRILPNISSLFIIDDDGVKALRPDPIPVLKSLIVTAIIDELPPSEVSKAHKGHISSLIAKTTIFWHYKKDVGGRIRVTNKQVVLDTAAKHAKRGHPIINLALHTIHWKFHNDWYPYEFHKVYTTATGIPSDETGLSVKPPSRSRLVNIQKCEQILLTHHLQAVFGKDKATDTLPPKQKHRTKPMAPVVSKTLPVPSPPTIVPSGTTDLVPTKTTVLIPCAGASPVTANLGPLQPVGPIADTPSVKAPHYIWTWTYSPNSESVSFRRVRSGSVSFQRATSLSSPVRRRDKSPPCESTNFQWTFYPQSETVVFHRLPKPAPVPLKPSLQLPLFKAIPEDTILASAIPTFEKHSAYPSLFCCAIHSNPNQTVFCITKRHRDALKIKMYHLYANILSMNWFYDTFD
eukprot:jgi/Psemu1/27964/gm1.27964_g